MPMQYDPVHMMVITSSKFEMDQINNDVRVDADTKLNKSDAGT